MGSRVITEHWFFHFIFEYWGVVRQWPWWVHNPQEKKKKLDLRTLTLVSANSKILLEFLAWFYPHGMLSSSLYIRLLLPISSLNTRTSVQEETQHPSSSTLLTRIYYASVSYMIKHPIHLTWHQHCINSHTNCSGLDVTRFFSVYFGLYLRINNALTYRF